MKSFIFILFISISFFINAQTNKIDSLKNELEKSQEDTNKVLLQNEIYTHFKNNDPQNAISYAQEALTLSQKLEYKKGIMVSNYNIGRTHLDNGNYEKAIIFFNNALESAIELNYTYGISTIYNVVGTVHKEQGDYNLALEYFLKCKKLKEESGDKDNLLGAVLSNIGGVYESQGLYDDALEIYFESLNIAEDIGFTRLIGNALNNIGVIYWHLGNYEKELEYYRKSLTIKEELDDKKGISTTTNNIGETLLKQGQLDEALEFFNRSLELKYQLNDEDGIVHAHSNIGVTYQNKNEYSKALDSYNESLKIANKINSKANLPEIYNNLGQLYFEIKQYRKAIEYYQIGLSIGLDLGLKKSVMRSYMNLSVIYFELNNYKNAYENHLKYVNIKDTLFNETSSKQIAEMQTKYETEKKEQEIDLLKKDQELKAIKIGNQKTIFNFSIIASIALILILLLIFSRYRLVQNRSKLKLEKQQAETENRLLRSQMNPHFIFNSLYSIQGFVSKKESELAETYLADFALLMRSILNNSSKSFVTLENELDTLKLYMKLEQLRFDNRFSFEIVIDKSVEQEFILIPPMLIQPFVENSILHGLFPKLGSGSLVIEIKENENSLSCSIIDDGIGREESQKRKKSQVKSHKSIGLEVTKNRLQLLGNEMKVETSLNISDIIGGDNKAKGTRVDIVIPIKDA